jgi:hypothetical protein
MFIWSELNQVYTQSSCFSASLDPLERKQCSSTADANFPLPLSQLHIVIYFTTQSQWAVYHLGCRPNRNSIVYIVSPAIQWLLSVMPSLIRFPFIGRDLNTNTYSNCLLSFISPSSCNQECRVSFPPFFIPFICSRIYGRKENKRIEKNEPSSFLDGSCTTKNIKSVFPPLISCLHTYTQVLPVEN